MDKKLQAALAKRLAAYSATAGIALAAAPNVGAQVVYHDLDPNVDVNPFLPDGPYHLDFDDDGTTDLDFRACDIYNNDCTYTYNRYYTYVVSLRRPDGAPALNGVFGYDAPRFANPIYGVASRLSSGTVVGPPTTGDFYPVGIAAYNAGGGPPRYPFFDQVGYAGFQFVAADGQRHYGWIRLSAFGFPDLTGRAFEWAYEAAPDTPIVAGAVSDATLDGAVNETSFPAEGGTLVYTVTVTNHTSSPLPLDLWLDADGPAAFSRRLGSGTLPPGAAVTRALSVRVPAGAPAGDYDVRFKVGDFASGQFITFERYTITKQAGAVAAEGGEAFAVTPAEGDLFASGAASVEGVGTHVLSAPRPNPSSGQFAFTLAVAEAQAVRVEVLDALGRRVAVLLDGAVGAGTEQRLAFDGSGLPAGVYVVRAVGETFADARVVSLTR